MGLHYQNLDLAIQKGITMTNLNTFVDRYFSFRGRMDTEYVLTGDDVVYVLEGGFDFSDPERTWWRKEDASDAEERMEGYDPDVW